MTCKDYDSYQKWKTWQLECELQTQRLQKLEVLESKPLAKLQLTIDGKNYEVIIYDYAKAYQINEFWTLNFVYEMGDGTFRLIITKQIEGNLVEDQKALEIETRKICQNPHSSFDDILSAIHKYNKLKGNKKYEKLLFDERVDCTHSKAARLILYAYDYSYAPKGSFILS